METIHVKFDKLTAIASECNNSGPGTNCSNLQDSSEELNETPSKEDSDNLFGPLYEEYYVKRTPECFTDRWTKSHPVTPPNWVAEEHGSDGGTS
ncbi:hypothetical protein Tco_0795545 [Tanacetum coccineum]